MALFNSNFNLIIQSFILWCRHLNHGSKFCISEIYDAVSLCNSNHLHTHFQLLCYQARKPKWGSGGLLAIAVVKNNQPSFYRIINPKKFHFKEKETNSKKWSKRVLLWVLKELTQNCIFSALWFESVALEFTKSTTTKIFLNKGKEFLYCECIWSNIPRNVTYPN